MMVKESRIRNIRRERRKTDMKAVKGGDNGDMMGGQGEA